MKPLSIPELLEQIRDRDARIQEQEAKDHEYKVEPKDLRFARDKIKRWKYSYFRKNSKKKATIRCIWSTVPIGDGLKNLFELQLFVKGKLEEEWVLRHEAFDVLVRDIKPESNSSCDVFTLETINEK